VVLSAGDPERGGLVGVEELVERGHRAASSATSSKTATVQIARYRVAWSLRRLTGLSSG
jgi:hypothetical protein